MKLPAKDSAVFRAILTALQCLLAIFVAATADVNIRAIVTQYYPTLTPVLVGLAGGASLILNLIRKDVINY